MAFADFCENCNAQLLEELKKQNLGGGAEVHFSDVSLSLSLSLSSVLLVLPFWSIPLH